MDWQVLSISVPYMVATALVVQALRGFLVPGKTPFYQGLILEFLATFEFLATVFEIGVLFETYGFQAFAISLLIMANYWGSSWGGATGAPHPHIVDIIQGNGSRFVSLSKILAELAAASLVFTVYVRPYWSLGLLPIHAQRIARTQCFSFLKVPLYSGIAMEAAGTFAFMNLAKQFKPMKYNFLSVPLCLVIVKRILMPYTGGFLNPVLGSTLQFNCEGTSVLEHMLVYWIGPTIGLLGFHMQPKQSIARAEEIKKQKEGEKAKKKDEKKKKN